MTIKHIFTTLLVLFTFNVSAQENEFDPFEKDSTVGQLGNNTADEEATTSVVLISEITSAAPGSTITLAIQLEHSAGWHSYYKNPGGAGLPLKFDWELPEGYELKKLYWPTPHLYKSSSMTQFYVYEGIYTILADISVPSSAVPDSDTLLKVTAHWQLCDEKGCLNPENKELSSNISIGKVTQLDESRKDFFIKARQALPLTNSPWEIAVYKQGGKFIIDLNSDKTDLNELKDLVFISSDFQTNGTKPQHFEKTESGYQITVPVAKETAVGESVQPLDHLSGIIVSKTEWVKGDSRMGLVIRQIPIGIKPLESANITTLLGIVGLMMLGGLILNLMPCVFPVIGLKIMGFAQQAGQDHKKIVIHGITFALGVLTSFWVLAGILLSLRNRALEGSGEEVGWGYQLQNPYVVLTILLLMFILALNMFGVFEIGTSASSVGSKLQDKQGLQGSFFSGVLATIVATPCSAPFLGAAIGAAFALPNAQFMLAFTAMAVGLAIPYLVLSIFPNMIAKLPRPGSWMESFKQGMSFLLFATAGYLLWIYLAQTGLEFMFNMTLGLTLVAISTWIYGRWDLPHRPQKVKIVARTLTSITFATGILLMLPADKSKQLEWENWSAEAVEELQDEDIPVFVDFTATWCATCQVNKKNAYPTEIVELFKEFGIVPLKADKTSSNPEIEKKLQELGRTAIPVNVLYIPGNDEPIITPEILTADYLRELIISNLEKPSVE